MTPPAVSSARHPLVAAVRELDGPRGRRAGLCVAEGPHLVAEAVRAGLPLLAVLYTPEFAGRPEGRACLDAAAAALAGTAAMAVRRVRAPEPWEPGEAGAAAGTPSVVPAARGGRGSPQAVRAPAPPGGDGGEPGDEADTPPGWGWGAPHQAPATAAPSDARKARPDGLAAPRGAGTGAGGGASAARGPGSGAPPARAQGPTRDFPLPPALAAVAGSLTAVGPRAFAAMSGVETPQGVLAVVGLPGAAAARAAPLALALDGVQDPGNVGALARALAAFGGRDCPLLVGPGTADPFGRKALRASAGSVFRLAVRRPCDLPAALRRMREAGWGWWSLEPRGGTPLAAATLHRPCGFVVGSEGGGVSPAVRQVCRALTVPTSGEVESLGAAQAGTIALYTAAVAAS